MIGLERTHHLNANGDDGHLRYIRKRSMAIETSDNDSSTIYSSLSSASVDTSHSHTYSSSTSTIISNSKEKLKQEQCENNSNIIPLSSASTSQASSPLKRDNDIDIDDIDDTSSLDSIDHHARYRTSFDEQQQNDEIKSSHLILPRNRKKQKQMTSASQSLPMLCATTSDYSIPYTPLPTTLDPIDVDLFTDSNALHENHLHQQQQHHHQEADDVHNGINFDDICSTSSLDALADEDLVDMSAIGRSINNNKASVRYQTHHTQVSDSIKLSIPTNLILNDVQYVSFNPSLFRGPTTESNWVILDRLMMGAYPASLDDSQHFEVSRRLLKCGIRTFVCLQDEYDHFARPDQWKSGKRIRPYIYDTAEVFQKDPSIFHNAKERSKTIEMLHVSIKDCSITTDKLVLDLAEEMCWRLCKGEVMYIHCWGGHGRTGTIIAVMLGMLFALDANEALARTQHFHDLRHSPLGAQCPQTVQQRNQVRRVLNEYFLLHQGESFIYQFLNAKVKSGFSPFTLFKMTIE